MYTIILCVCVCVCVYVCFRQCKERYVRTQKERDYHRMHHRRVMQEKNKLITDVKRYIATTITMCSGGEVMLAHVYVFRMKEHFSQYEPLMQQLKHKYQVSTCRTMALTVH